MHRSLVLFCLGMFMGCPEAAGEEIDEAPSGAWVTIRPSSDPDEGEEVVLTRHGEVVPLPESVGEAWMINPAAYRLAVAEAGRASECCGLADRHLERIGEGQRLLVDCRTDTNDCAIALHSCQQTVAAQKPWRWFLYGGLAGLASGAAGMAVLVIKVAD